MVQICQYIHFICMVAAKTICSLECMEFHVEQCNLRFVFYTQHPKKLRQGSRAFLLFETRIGFCFTKMSCDLKSKSTLLFCKGDSEGTFISRKCSSYHSEITCEKPFRKKRKSGKENVFEYYCTTVYKPGSGCYRGPVASSAISRPILPQFHERFMAFNFADVAGYL